MGVAGMLLQIYGVRGKLRRGKPYIEIDETNRGNRILHGEDAG